MEESMLPQKRCASCPLQAYKGARHYRENQESGSERPRESPGPHEQADGRVGTRTGPLDLLSELLRGMVAMATGWEN